VPKLLDEHQPDIVLHIGLNEGSSFFGIERGAWRDGYHLNLDLDRKVFTKAEAKARWGKCPARLQTGLDLDDVLGRWRGSKVVSELGKGKGKRVEVMVSDDVGDFVCGFIYYASLEAMERQRGVRDVVFLHVPPLREMGDVKVGVSIVEELIKALVASWLDGKSN
jgi:pyroglutamyl-peptidase